MTENNKDANSKEKNESFKNILNNDNKNNNKKNDKIQEKENLDNVIIGNFKIEGDDLRQRIISSYEDLKRENIYIFDDELKKIEEEIKDCEIFINDNKIDFTYFYKFPKTGNYIIKYKFKKLLKKMCYMFAYCHSLTHINLSNFNTQNVTGMSYMFTGSNSLVSLNLSNINT